MTDKRIRMVIDIAMAVLLPLLMAYSLIGEEFHEIAGTIMIGLFVAHLTLNRRWYKAVPKGKYNALRTFRTALDFVLLFFMVMQPLSGVLMSKHLYLFAGAAGASAWARQFHLPMAYWGFLLVCLHAGTHLQLPLSRLSARNPKAAGAVLAVLSVVSAFGVYAFIKRNFAGYMFLATPFAFFDYNEPVALYLIDYVAVMVLFAVIGLLFVSVMSRRKVTTDPK